jgi:hypothetical protein
VAAGVDTVVLQPAADVDVEEFARFVGRDVRSALAS